MYKILFYLSVCPVFNSCRRLPETKRHFPLFLHWYGSKFHVVMADCTPSIHVFLDIFFSFLFYNKFIICIYMFRALCAHHQDVKIVLYSNWYRHTFRWPSHAQVERRLTNLLSTCAPDGHLQVWRYQMLYNTILTSWWWVHSARNM